jgi:branched-chain amino acid transport system substrate-binding protein
MVWLWLALLPALVLPAHAGDPSAIRLGLVVPVVSEAAAAAQSMQRAADLAVAAWGPRLGRRIELTLKDDTFDPRQAMVAAEQLREEGVWGVVGHFFSSSSIAASAVYHDAGIPQVTTTSTHPRLTAQGFDTVFRVCGRDDQQALVAADFVLTRLHARRVGVVHDRTEYGRRLVEAFRLEVARRGGTRVVAWESLAQGDRDFGAQIARLTAARLDAIYFGGIFREAGHLIRQVRQAGLDVPFVSGDGVLDAEFVALAGEGAARGAYLTFAPDPRLRESARPLIRQYESQYGSLGPYVLDTYDAVGVLLRAIEVAKPVDQRQAELRKVVRAIHDRPYQGALGTLRWDRNGDVAPVQYALYVTKRGGSVKGWFEQLLPAALGGRGPSSSGGMRRGLS